MNPAWLFLLPLVAFQAWLLLRRHPAEFETVPDHYLDDGPVLRFKGYTLYRELFLVPDGLVISHTFSERPVPDAEPAALPPGMEVRLHRRSGSPYLYPIH